MACTINWESSHESPRASDTHFGKYLWIAFWYSPTPNTQIAFIEKPLKTHLKTIKSSSILANLNASGIRSPNFARAELENISKQVHS